MSQSFNACFLSLYANSCNKSNNNKHSQDRDHGHKPDFLEDQGNLLIGIDNKTVRRLQILNLFTYVLFSVAYSL